MTKPYASPILSIYSARSLLSAIGKKRSARVSLDLGMSVVSVDVDKDCAHLPDDVCVTPAQLKKIIKNDTSCFLCTRDGIQKIHFFDENVGKYFKLVPSGAQTPPTFEISGIRMHVTKSMDPRKDTQEKLKTLAPIKGTVLDCCMGLGYTAIAAAKDAKSVLTCELNPAVIELCKMNPWSQELFTNKKITVEQDDTFDLVAGMPSNSINFVIHDPPSYSIAPNLYSQDFYDELYRIMRTSGKLYHYTGSPGSKKRRIDLPGNTIKRLQESGFSKLARVHFGVRAKK